jgi:hypothetical protein
MNWEKLDWNALQRLRGLFVGLDEGQNRDLGHSDRSYWESSHQLESYHLTLGERIGWKWDSVLRELQLRGVSLEHEEITDWGCGTGIASLRGLALLPQAQRIRLFDKAEISMSFARQKVKELRPEVIVESLAKTPESADLLLISHVLNEVQDEELPPLLGLVKNSKKTIWVENGTRNNSRRLSKLRDSILKQSNLEILAPCPHQKGCGVLDAARENEWCHSFAKVPSEVHQDPAWRDFSKRLGVDLRSLSYSFVVFAQKKNEAPMEDQELFRLMGRPREYKGFSKLLTCHGQHGVSEFILQKRDAPELFKALQKERFIKSAPLLKLKVQGQKIQSGEML